MTTFLIIAFMVAVDALIFLVIRTYERRGTIIALPWPIERDKTPRWFRFNQIIGWISFWLAVAFTLVMSVSLLFGNTNA
jgi:hypothetical protein